MTLDDIPFGEPLTPPNPAAVARKCRRHDWRDGWTDGKGFAIGVRHADEVPAVGCIYCGAVRDEARSRRSRLNGQRGRSIEREVARTVEMEHVPGNMPEDAIDERFVAEVKSGPSWYSRRVEAELDDLPTRGGRTPLFIAASTPGPGRKRRVYVTVSLGDLVRMVGPHAQVSMWAPEWVALKRETE